MGVETVAQGLKFCGPRKGLDFKESVTVHQIARKDDIHRPRYSSKNNISMINTFTLTNINTEVIEAKLSKTLISEVCIKQEPLALIRTQEVARSFKQVGDPCPTWLAGTGLSTTTGKPTEIATIEIFGKTYGLRFL